MDTPKEDGGATSPAERHVVVPVELLERAKYILANNAADGDELAAKIFTALTALSAAPPVQMAAVAWFIHDPDAMFMTTNKATVETHSRRLAALNCSAGDRAPA